MFLYEMPGIKLCAHRFPLRVTNYRQILLERPGFPGRLRFLDGGTE